MKQISLWVCLVCCTMLIPLNAGAQTGNRPRLAVLPFSGGSGQDGANIATMLSNRPALRGAFTVIDRTVVDALMQEQDFQSSTGLTDPDTIGGLGTMLNAEYVIAGHIQRLSNRNLVHITIMHVERLQQIAGVYKEYRAIEEVPSLLDPMAQTLVKAAQVDSTNLPKLAVLPFDIPDGPDAEAAETLSQILASEIANSGKYAVLPRTQAAIDRIMEEQEMQSSGLTDEDTVSRLGGGLNAEFVLAGQVLSLGKDNYFDVKIVKTDGAMISGDSRPYQSIADGLVLMPQLAEYLTGLQDERQQAEARERLRAVELLQQQAEEDAKRLREAAARKAQAEEAEQARLAQVEAERKQAAEAEQARLQAEAARKVAWKNKWLYFGFRGGVSARNYTLNEDIPAEYYDSGTSFEGAVQLSFQFTRFLALQVEGIFTQDKLEYEGSNDYKASFTDMSVMLPVALKLTFRPGPVLIAPFVGAYYNLPIGDMAFESSIGDASYTYSRSISFMAGLDLGFKLGPGVLFIDARYGADLGNTSLSDDGGTLQIYQRESFSLSLGYEIGIFNRKAKR